MRYMTGMDPLSIAGIIAGTTAGVSTFANWASATIYTCIKVTKAVDMAISEPDKYWAGILRP